MRTCRGPTSSPAVLLYQLNPVSLLLQGFGRIRSALLTLLGPPSRPSSSSSQGTSRSPGISPNHLYLYMPYLHFDTYKNIIRRRNVIRRRMSHGRARPVPPDIAQLESLDCRVIWEYIGHDPPLNARRTLDQYGYPALRDTYARDDDQMLYKLTKERLTLLPKDRQDMYNMRNAEDEQPPIISPGSPLAMNADTPLKSDAASYKYESDEDLESDILDGNVLMVDQLWLWAIDESASLLSTPTYFTASS